MSKRFDYNFVKKFCKEKGFVLLSDEYINNHTKLNLKCKNNHEFEMSFANVRINKGCKYCHYNSKRLSTQDVKDYLEKYNFELLSDYKNNKTNITIKCSNGHVTEKTFSDFKKYHSCKECVWESKFGEGNTNWNPNRDEVSLNKKLRISRSFKWIKDNLQNDVNYKKYLNNRDLYHIDHIIPVALFSKLLLHYNLNEKKLKKIINSKDNLQILLKTENQEKYSHGNIFEACQFLNIKGIKL